MTKASNINVYKFVNKEAYEKAVKLDKATTIGLELIRVTNASETKILWEREEK